MLSWYRELKSTERKTMTAASGGRAVDALIRTLSDSIGLDQAIAGVAGCACGLVIAMVLALPETRGKQLAVYD